MSRGDDDNFSVLDYARFHGLTIDYTTESLLGHDITAPSDNTLFEDLADASNTVNAYTIGELTKERLVVNKDAAILLKAVLSAQQATSIALESKDRRNWMRGIKQELPILSTDSDIDLLGFGNAVLPDLRKLKIPSEVTNEERDEGFQWPSKYLAYPAQCDEQVKAERLVISREVLLCLQDAVKDEYNQEEIDRVTADALERKPAVTRHITPPLLPLPPSPSPYVPSSPTSRLPLPSSSSNSIATEVKALEQHIMAADSLERRCSDSSDPMLLDDCHLSHSSPLIGDLRTPPPKRRAEDLKVEGPLTPLILSTSPLKKLKSVSFAPTLDEYIPDTAWWRDDFSDGRLSSEPDFDKLFGDMATQAQKKVENEHLSGADTTARVDVPKLDFALPVAPWKEYSQRKNGKHPPDESELDVQMRFLLRLKREDLRTTTSWHGVSALERELHWGVLTMKSSSVNLEEKLHGESEANKILAELATGNVVTSSCLVWKPDGLRILDQEEEEEMVEEEEIEAEVMREQRDTEETLIRKRKPDVGEDIAGAQRKRAACDQSLGTYHQTAQQVESHHWKGISQKSQSWPNSTQTAMINFQQGSQPSMARRKTAGLQPLSMTNNELMFGGFSASTALQKFMETRGKPVTTQSSGTLASKSVPLHHDPFSTAHSLAIRSRESSSEQNACISLDTSAGLPTSKSKSISPAISLSKPIILPEHRAPCSFIVSSTLLQQKYLIKDVEQLYLNAELAYRDYSLLHSPVTEADILLSPSTGLIFATLQQAKQRGLPGQPDNSPLKARMMALQLRYERLLVMISEGLSRDMEEQGTSRPEDARDKEALAQLEGLAAQLEGEVLLKYVRGGEKALARATVVEMVNYGLPHGSADIGDVKPCAEETTWEIFLRRAGFNPFAAQVIAAKLSRPFAIQLPMFRGVPESSLYARTMAVSGLSAFLVMGSEERIQYFQAILGGNRILRRASKVLDQEWVSAAHGFRM